MPRVIFHLDMDAFYASVEQRDKPELRGKPVIVGSPPTRRGVVCAASYEARKFGVRSAMPSVTAGRLCPNGVFVPPDMERYQEESKRIMAIVAETGANIEQVSIDEAYLDLTDTLASSEPTTFPWTGGNPVDDLLFAAVPLAQELKLRIRKERHLNTSIGIAGNKLLAKLASDFNKPNGLALIPERDKVQFLRNLPVRDIHGVGKVTEQTLIKAGLPTIGHLQDYPGDLRHLLGSFGPALKRYAFGEDDRPVETWDTVKSISSENTFLEDTDDRAKLRACLKEQAEEIATKLQRNQLGAYTVQVKVRYSDFTTLTRQQSFEDPVTDARTIYRTGCHLLGREKLVNRPLRLIGLGVSSLGEPLRRQLELPLE